jgi:hypothetical protein
MNIYYDKYQGVDRDFVCVLWYRRCAEFEICDFGSNTVRQHVDGLHCRFQPGACFPLYYLHEFSASRKNKLRLPLRLQYTLMVCYLEYVEKFSVPYFLA